MSESLRDVRTLQLRLLNDMMTLETARISRQTVWYPLMVASGIIAGTTVMVLALVWLFFGWDSGCQLSSSF